MPSYDLSISVAQTVRVRIPFQKTTFSTGRNLTVFSASSQCMEAQHLKNATVPSFYNVCLFAIHNQSAIPRHITCIAEKLC